jgi:hypothetical protein
MRHILLLCLLAIPALSFAQPAPRYETFLINIDSLVYRIESVVITSGEDPNTREKMNMRAGSDFNITLKNARFENDTVYAECIIDKVSTTIDMPDYAPAHAPKDTTFQGWEFEGRPALAAFSKEGKLYSLKPAEYSDDDFEMSLSKFEDMVKMAFTLFDDNKAHSAGDRWKAMQIDTEYVYDMPLVTKSFYEMTWRGIVDTLGRDVSKYEFVVDSVQMADMPISMKFTEGGTRGVQLYDPRWPRRRMWYSHVMAKSELDMSFGMDDEEEKSKKGKKKSKTKKAPKPKPIMYIDLDVKATLLNK